MNTMLGVVMRTRNCDHVRIIECGIATLNHCGVEQGC